jgi:hypothetical protein
MPLVPVASVFPRQSSLDQGRTGSAPAVMAGHSGDPLTPGCFELTLIKDRFVDSGTAS